MFLPETIACLHGAVQRAINLLPHHLCIAYESVSLHTRMSILKRTCSFWRHIVDSTKDLALVSKHCRITRHSLGRTLACTRY